MGEVIEFSVRGIPVPQGSAKAFVVKGRAVVTHANSKTKGWREDVATAAQPHAPKALWEGAVSVEARFVLPRPASVSQSKRPLPTTKPDLDKLVRAAIDALTGIVWRDDCQVTTIVTTKRYDDGAVPGLKLRAEHLT